MKRRITSLFLMLCMAFSFLGAFSLPAHAATIDPEKPSYGTGIADDPYQIGTAAELEWFRDKVIGSNGLTAQADACAVLISDIDLSGDSNWAPIGNRTIRYTGTFNGQNHSITNLTSSGSGTVGFFGFISDATIKNLRVRGNLSSSETPYDGLGGIAGRAGGGVNTISNCSFAGNLYSSVNYNIGGIIGLGRGEGDDILDDILIVSNCSFTGSITNANCMNGGILGSKSYGTAIITDCSATTLPDETWSSWYCGGGIIGCLSVATATIERCYSTADFSWHVEGCGGLVGEHRYGSTLNISDSYYAGSAKYFIATIRGSGYTISRCHLYSTTGSSTWYNTLSDSTSPQDYFYSRLLDSSSSGVGATTNTGALSMPASMFTNTTNFPTWNFNTVWKMETNAKYPTLRPRHKLESEDDRTITLYQGDSGASFKLTDYFYISGDNGNNRFAYEIKEDGTGTVAEISGETLTFNTDLEIGNYPLTISVHDTKSEYLDFTFDLNFKLMERVPAPKVLTDEFKYSRMMDLSMVYLTDGWKWSDPKICPKDTNTDGYEAYYPFEEGKSAFYDLSAVTAADYTVTTDTENNRFKVMLSPKVLESDESQQETFITVIDEDTLEPIEGAVVATEYKDEFDYPGYNTTDSDGVAYGMLSPGYRDITVTKLGYETKTDTKQIEKGINRVTIYLRPNRTRVKIPDVRELISADSLVDADIKNPLVSVTRISEDDTLAWLGESVSTTASAMDILELPPGDFMFRNATYGYSTNDVVFARVDNQTVTFYSDSEFTPGTALTVDDHYTLRAVKMNDPTYNVTIDHADGSLTYTAKVTLSNIKANYGTFGLHFDPSIMEMTNITYGSDIDKESTELKTVEKFYAAQGAASWSNDNGYYVFVWDAKLDDETQETLINAETGTEDIATFTFKLKSSAYEDYITADTFTIEPWQDTKAAKSVSDAGLKELFSEYFRYVDSDNNSAALKEGRLAASKSAVTISDTTPITSTIETNGFFQARVPMPLGSDELEKDYDVKTEIKYNFRIKNAVIRFHVTDKRSGAELPNSFIRLFDYDQNFVSSKKTGEDGRTSFAVKPENYNEPTFRYDASKTGYWPLPEDGLISGRPPVLAETAKVTEVEVELEQKVYHKPVLKKDGDNKTLELVTDAELGGEKYAYNGRPYHFRVKAARGNKITAYPTKVSVYVNDTPIYEELKPNPNGLFTLDAKYLDLDRFEDLRALEYDELAALKAKDTDYEDWANAQPDAEGYRGYNIVIKFDDFETEEIEYIVEGMTNKNGHVSYSYSSSDNELPDDEDKRSTLYGAEDYSYMRVTTHNSKRDGGVNHNTGTFTFTGDNGCVVERVYINGLEVDAYDDLPQFTYSFGEVDMDCNITVIFWDGKNPTDDTVMTLVVGEYGFADTITPVDEKDITLTRRVYLNPSDNLEFEAHAMKGYTLYKVQKEVYGSKQLVDVASVSSRTETKVENPDTENETRYDIEYKKYTVSKPTAEEKNVTVYVTFMHPDAPTKKTPNLFVKSYVYTGTGVNDPAGILIYSKYDTVEIDLSTKENDTWLAKGVMLSPYENLDDVTEYEFPKPSKTNTYRYETLLTSIGIGSVFVEHGYPLSGYIDLGQSGTASDERNPLTGATITFVRLDETGTVEQPKAARYVRVSQPLRHKSLFSLDLPAGHWNVYVEKQGYVTYKITDFEMKATAYNEETGTYAETKFGVGSNGVQHDIAPYIGSTKTGTSISLTDASGIKSGLRGGLSAAQKTKADVDNDGNVTSTDLAYVWFNYNKLAFEQEYSDFKENGSKTKKYEE